MGGTLYWYMQNGNEKILYIDVYTKLNAYKEKLYLYKTRVKLTMCINRLTRLELIGQKGYSSERKMCRLSFVSQIIIY
jgi:hypothetical protein